MVNFIPDKKLKSINLKELICSFLFETICSLVKNYTFTDIKPCIQSCFVVLPFFFCHLSVYLGLGERFLNCWAEY